MTSTRPVGFLLRMVIFLALVAGVVFLLGEPVLRAFQANAALNGLILGVLLIGAAHAFRRVLILNVEIGWMENVQRRRSGSGRGPVASSASQPRLLATVASAMDEREGEIKLSPVSMRSLHDGITARLDESGETSRYFIGLVIFLGLLGTFWGLLETVASVGDVIAGLDVGGLGESARVFENLKSGLEAPLSGMGTAFSSSLFGLASALVLGFLDLQAGQAQSRFLNQLEDWLASATRLGGGSMSFEGEAPVPYYIQALLEQTAESLEDLRRIIGRAEEGRYASQQSLQALSERLTTLTEQMQAEQNLLVRLAEQQIELQPVLARIAERSEPTSVLDPQTRTHIHNIDLRLASLLEDAQTGRDEMIRELRNEIKLLARTVSMLRGEERR